MPRYVFQWNITEAGIHYFEGQEIKTDRDFADWMNRNSPGVLVEKAAEGRAVTSAPQHRMVTSPVDSREAEEAEPEPEVNATDSAIELAEKNNVKVQQVKGSGAEGRVLKKDVEALL